MTDVVVSVPRQQWAQWVDAGQTSNEQCALILQGTERPPVEPGDRVYVVSWDRLRGYSTLTHIELRGADIVLWRAHKIEHRITLPAPIKSFPGWRVRWWARDEEIPFEEWRTAGVDVALAGASAPKRRAPTKLSFVHTVNLQTKGRPQGERILSPAEYQKQLSAAYTELETHNALSWTHADKGWEQREIWSIRCGAAIGMGRLCMRPRKHEGDCDKAWAVQ